jgi:para-nitrobenzyl esterase
LLVGWNANEATPYPPFASSPAEFHEKAQRIYGNLADQFEALYPTPQDQAFGPMSDGLFAWQAYTLARAHLINVSSPTYVYHFTRVPPWYPDQHFAELDPPAAYGAYHTAEQPYFYNNLDLVPRPYAPADRALSDAASSYLINFATSGDPNGTGLPAWPVFDQDSGPLLYLGETITVGPVPRKEALDFFDAFYAAAR